VVLLGGDGIATEPGESYGFDNLAGVNKYLGPKDRLQSLLRKRFVGVVLPLAWQVPLARLARSLFAR
jgi:hypothetical protein